MFDRKKPAVIEESKNSEHCFMTLNSAEISKALSKAKVVKAIHEPDDLPTTYTYYSLDELICQFLQSPIRFIFQYRFYENKKTYMTCSKTLDASLDATLPPSALCTDPFSFVLKEYEWRLSVEFNISLDKLNKLLGSLISLSEYEYQGKKFIKKNSMEESVRQALSAALFDTHVDIKNATTGEWSRVDSLKPKPERLCCRIL